MTIYRGPGGTGSANSDIDTTEFQNFLVQSEAARDAALAAEVAAELAAAEASSSASGASTSATAAASSASAASTSATNAASSASTASTQATNASNSASAASTSATAAASSATAAASSATSAASSATSASASASTATTKAAEASTSATNAATSATSAANSASTATTQATNASNSASAAATSATNASNSASAASTSASNAATSETNAASSATAAAASAAEAAATLSSTVKLTGDQTIAGIKTFSSTISGSISGNAGTVTNGVVTTGSYADPSWITSLAGSKVSGNISGNATNVTGIVPITNGGTGQTTANAAFNALAPSQTSNSGKYLTTDGSNTSWATSAGGFPSGTAMLFAQTAAPTGWTKSTTHDNKALRVVSGTASSGGTVAFTTAFSSKAVSGTVGSTTLTIAQMPSHTHTYNVPTASAGGLGSLARTFVDGNTGATGGGGSHNHTFTGTAIDLAVQYVDVIIATKD